MLLASIPSPSHGVWQLGVLPIRAYALIIVAGILFAVWWGRKRWVAKGGQAADIEELAFWAVPAGIVGGRLYHVITDAEIYFGPNGKGFWAALRIWDGGLGIWGAIALGFAAAALKCKRQGWSVADLADALAPAIIVAQAIGSTKSCSALRQVCLGVWRSCRATALRAMPSTPPSTPRSCTS